MAIISLITYFVICCVGIDKIFWLRFFVNRKKWILPFRIWNGIWSAD